MLISMPTDTSTIFGAFQAISLSIATGRTFRPAGKLLWIGKFASKFFARVLRPRHVALRHNPVAAHGFVRSLRSKARGIRPFSCCPRYGEW
jgi:hypothetical protein